MSEIKNRNAKFALISIVTIGVLLIGFRFFKNFADDPDIGDFQSAGHIVAIELNNDGGRAVMFDEAGKRIDAPKPEKESYDDREVSWSADGQRIFISSNRELDSYNIYRWNPARDEIRRRSIGSRSQGAPWFWPGAEADKIKSGLIQSGGQIQELDTKTGDLSLVMPPSGDRVVGAEEGSKGAMDAYSRFGQAFLKARFAGSRDRIFALMRNDEGYTLIYQPIGLDQMGQPLRPVEMYRGDRVDLDTDLNGVVGVVIDGFAFPDYAEIPAEYIKDGKVVPPFGSGVFRIEVDASNVPNAIPVVLAPPDAEETLGDIAVSPDGTKVAVVVGKKLDGGGFEPLVLLVMPFTQNGGQNATPVVQGAVSSPSWSPDGSKLTYLLRDGSNVDVYRSNADGSGATKLTNGGKWSMPQFSPATGG